MLGIPLTIPDRRVRRPTILPSWATGSPEWHEQRRHGIGGSDLAAILGISPWTTPLAVWAEKTGRSPGAAETTAMRMGSLLEPVVAALYADQHPEHDVQQIGQALSLEDPVMRGSADRIAHTDDATIIIEIKTTRRPEDWWGGEIPPHYMLQLQHYLRVYGVSHGVFAVLAHGRDYSETPVEYDAHLMDDVWAEARAWWDAHVITDTPPDPTFPADSSILAHTWTPDLTAQATIPHDLHQALVEARADARAATARQAALEAEIKTLLGPATTGIVDGQPAWTWRPQSSSRLDTRRLRADQPDIIRQYTSTTTTRVLRATTHQEDQ
ncbi:MAG: YqaJ viral recombinase family nuclease [Dermatophilaceae bacterium]